MAALETSDGCIPVLPLWEECPIGKRLNKARLYEVRLYETLGDLPEGQMLAM